MTNLSDIIFRVSSLLMDNSRLIWPEEALTESIRQALEEYNLAAPLTREGSFPLENMDQEIPLDSLPGFCEIVHMQYPWTPEAAGKGRPNQVKGWHSWFAGGKPFATIRGPLRLEPGAHLRVLYLASHTLAGLDGAEHTTIPPEHYGLLVRGTAAFAALSRALDKIELRDYGSRRIEPELLSNWGAAQAASFRSGLSSLRQSLPPFPSPHWQMDRWESRMGD
jgi:hypothetical protein